ncbi:DUF3465 domain-containing protein [Bdellovibrio svalbardensis]|uniref:DUF3465 domain-containing protein n=1 Tax=Bdellovibrio svalbardensis TaxID=2972972 RepID=A0ABT6DLY8_9BACT|nr:DUF3465 domain-containing protein [Bdellovibrio svalbardensis]MDG0817890.1 DUF3465 domain-containing protein [Bdellovibrio svalbardensis]
MKAFSKLVLLSLTATLVISTAEAKNKHGNNSSQEETVSFFNPTAGDAMIVRAVEGKKRVNFVEGSGMVVIQLLPDDNSGLKHQKWVVRLSNGKLMQAVYNSDMCPRVPIKVGDVVAMGGMFLWTEVGAMLHWLHHDPRGNRPDGYVMVNGTYYCKD